MPPPWSGPQGAFNRFIRPSLAPGELLLLPCGEANAFPGADGCVGEHLHHYWFHKERLLERLHAEFGCDARRGLAALLRTGGHLQDLA